MLPETMIVLKPKVILRHVQEGEEVLWIKSDLASLGEAAEKNDPATTLVRKSQLVQQIHQYFGSLEPRKCCLALSGGKTSFTNVRLVRNDGRDSGIEEGAMFRSPVDMTETVRDLSSHEERVFKRAYLCASYPVLCAPEPPSPLSPPPVAQDNKKFHFKGQLTIARPPTPDDSGLEDDMTVVPADTLFELLRRTFHLSQEKFHTYEHQIYRYHQRKDPSRILAEELVGQLALLENNTNPCYNPELFMSPSGYDSWQRMEFSHIANLLKKFWHTAYPPVPNNCKQNQRGILEDYSTLLLKLLRYESPYRVEGEVLAPGLSCLLSSASVRLLREFGLRYGIREVYRKLVYLHYLTGNFVPSPWFIQHTCSSLASVLDMLPNSGASHVLLKIEYDILEESLGALERLGKSNLSKMKSLFPQNKPSDGLDSLLDLVILTQKGHQYLVNKKSLSVEKILKSSIQSIFPVCYEEHKIVAIKDLHQKDHGLSATLMNKMICKIRDEVKDYKDNYQSTFEKYFNITLMAAESLYGLLMEDIARVCQNQPKNPYIDKCMLGLAYRLSQLDQAWVSYISEEQQTWRPWFEIEQINWIEILKGKLIRLTKEGISKDKFEGYLVEDIHSITDTPVSSLADYRIRSVSSKSITPSINSAFSGMMSSLHSTPLHTNFMPVQRPDSKGNRVIPVAGNMAGNSGSWLGKLHLSSSAPGPLRDTQSLCEFSEEDEEESDGLMTFSNLRHSSSVPEMLSKSYDHHLDVMRPSAKIPDLQGNGTIPLEEQDKKGSSKSLQQDTSLLKGEGVWKDSLLDSQSDSDQNEEIATIIENDVPVPSTSHDNRSTRSKQDDSDKEGEETPTELNPHQQLLNENAMGQTGLEGRPDGDQDSLAGEFTQSFGEEDREGDQGSLSSVQDSPVQNFDFPPMSEVVTLDSEKLSQNTPTPQREVVKPSASRVKPPDASTSEKESVDPQSLSTTDDSSQEKQTSSSSDIPASVSSVKSASIPVSSSLFDLLVLLQRTIGFGKTLSQNFHRSTPGYRTSDLESSFSSSTTAGSFFGGETRKKLYYKFHEVLCSTLTMYADNMLCLDLCGTTRNEGIRLVGAKMVNHLQNCKQSQKIWGCRHQIQGINNCFQYVNRRADMLCDRYEPVSQAMCIRMNNVSSLLPCSEVFFKKLASVFSYEWSQVSPTCTDLYGFDEGGNPNSMTSCQNHFHSILRSLARLIAYRLNLFVYDAMAIFLTLRDSRRSVAASLTPLSQFLGSYIDLLNQWLYLDNFHIVMENLWIFIVQDFESEIVKLAQSENSLEAAKQLVQAFTTLLKLMTSKDGGIHRGHLLSQAESVMFKLQIYTTASNQLVQLYEKLMETYYMSDTVSICTLDGTVKTILHRIREDLLIYRKCFSGAHLISWIMNHPELFYQFDPELENTENGREKRWTAISIAESLLRTGVIVDLDAEEEPESDEEDDELIPFPEISITGENGASSFHDRSLSFDTTPRVTPVPQRISQDSQRSHSPKKRSLHHSLHTHFRGTPVLHHSLRSHDPQQGHVTNQVTNPTTAEKHHQPVRSSLHQSLRTHVLSSPVKLTQSLKAQRNESVQVPFGQTGERSCVDVKESSSCGEPAPKAEDSNDTGNPCTSTGGNQVNQFPDRTGEWSLPFCATPNLNSSMLDNSFQDSEFQFEDSRKRYYRIASFADSLSPGRSSSSSEELNCLVEKCFEIKIVPDFVFRILLSRKNFDNVAKIYVESHAEGKHGDYLCGIS